MDVQLSDSTGQFLLNSDAPAPTYQSLIRAVTDDALRISLNPLGPLSSLIVMLSMDWKSRQQFDL